MFGSSKKNYDPDDDAVFYICAAAILIIVAILAVLNLIYPGKVQQYQWLPLAMIVAGASGIWIASYRPGTNWSTYLAYGLIISGFSGLLGSLYLYGMGTIVDVSKYFKQSLSNAIYFMLVVAQTFMIGGLSADRFRVQAAKPSIVKRAAESVFGGLRRFSGAKQDKNTIEKWLPAITAGITASGLIVPAAIQLISKWLK
ncbi:hypothetical protein [Methylobacterium sp. UNC300MFChir4.1]|uniref:hypothetical protein n=1 Tax=Methylobacterium sp. UNC300MFChir4.1 TaxID=1502747 RepID=UPI001114399F|nr:hypothetical protein [Methylobacterium sp. UNC300MFChir4.1]